MSVYLIRHGKTAANEQHLYCGCTDLPVSESGMLELKGIRYSVSKGVRYVSSGMKRCNETLRALFGDVPFSVDPQLREINFGIFEMHSYEQLKNDPLYIQWISGDNEKNIPPEGESGEEMTRRVWDRFLYYFNLDGDTVIVTHGGVIAAIMEKRFPQEQKNRYQWQPKPGGGYHVFEDGYRLMKCQEKEPS